MTREKYSIILPVLVFALIVLGFGLAAVIPNLQTTFFLTYVLCGGVIVVVIDRLFRRKVPGPLVDERVAGIAHSASWLSYRVTFVILTIGGFVLIYAFPSIQGLRLLGIGALISVAIQSLVYWIAFATIQRQK